MKRLRHWARQGAKKLLRWVFVDELAEIKQIASEARLWAEQATVAVRDYYRQLSALQALDVGMHEAGKIIILTRVNGADKVKIVDSASDMTLSEYQGLVLELQDRYGARVGYVDVPLSQRGAFDALKRGE